MIFKKSRYDDRFESFSMSWRFDVTLKNILLFFFLQKSS